ncbi:hypothetical protein [Spirillospora albida]|uniref:hypothetical protein n=1 Tax=Spirillospora albida TaxID=58123 RepID=UPI00068E2233|nr:hypothetical protein [Spirillospora albida]
MSDRTGLDPRTAERLLAGGPAPDAPEGLAALLAAASAPARPEETAGEDAAVAAFLAARPPAPRPARRVLSRVTTIKALIIAAALTGSGGVAIAAGTGNLPGQSPDPAPSTSVPEPETERDGVVRAPAVPSRTAPAVPSPSAKPTVQQPPGRQKPKKTPTPRGRPTTRKPNPGQGNGGDNGNAPTAVPSAKPRVIPKNSHAANRD